MVAWGWAKEEVYRAKSHTLEQLEDRIQKVITNVPHDFLQKTVDSIPGRLRKLVDAAGAYVELQVMHQYSHLKRLHVNIFFYLCFGNREVMTISQCLLTSQPPCT